MAQTSRITDPYGMMVLIIFVELDSNLKLEGPQYCIEFT